MIRKLCVIQKGPNVNNNTRHLYLDPIILQIL